MSRSARAARRARLAVLGAVACAAPTLAACEVSSAGEAEPSASVAAMRTAAADAGASTDEDVARRLEAFGAAVDIDGLELASETDSPVATASEHFDETWVVEPASCTELHDAIGLGTGDDHGDAADDLVDAVGFFVEGGVMPSEAVHHVYVQTRVFGDEEAAASLYPSLLEADCSAYTWTSTWDDGSLSAEHSLDEVAEVELEGLDQPSVRVDFAAGSWVLYDEGGEAVDEGSRDEGLSMYVHVEGPYAIEVEVIGEDDPEALAARLIGQFVDHMNAG
ncbi:hypothetical protein QQX09_07745 [Demequina sp. SYSU T00192]|uniref:Prokaryotic membrane lipoprotein lipid attachment site profile n=1 Tax=Demequina litoralis TaxID=3051660 RepID=A0ABT8G9E1_9MICO|nr:hypothetical protein [Demequina sp. SYSU T00192]MDN4475746.1 hypothetical protein [Demequina sp. SYSU T00192]